MKITKAEFKNDTLLLRPDEWEKGWPADNAFSARFVPPGDGSSLAGHPLVIQDYEGDRIAINPQEAAELMVYLAKVLGVVKP